MILFAKNLVPAGLVLSLVAFLSLPSRADDAAALYKSKCAVCHGADGKGDTPAGKKMGVRDFGSAEVQAMKDAELTAVIADGKNKMPGYKKSLSGDQIKDLVAYVHSFAKK
jgi:mono/diheme cytochrome c family protein